jgi:hypothetical protein
MTLPALLSSMIADGRWATVGDCDERISLQVARRWDPHASGIHLHAEPCSLASDLQQGRDLFDLWNTVDVDAERCLVIADFGLGSDNPIVLDFTQDPAPVRTQRWPEDETSRPTWITIASTFEDFAIELGLAP